MKILHNDNQQDSCSCSNIENNNKFSNNSLFSDYIVDGINEYQELDNFCDALYQHNKIIEVLENKIDVLRNRINILIQAKKGGIYSTPSEYDKHLISKVYCDQIEKKQQDMIQQKNLQQKMRNDKFKKKITKKFEYAKRCAEYIGNDRIYCYKGRGDIHLNRSLNTLLMGNYLHYHVYWKSIKNVIYQAHKIHNNFLIKNDKTKYKCPNCQAHNSLSDVNLNSNKKCYAYAKNYKTNRCGRKVFWDQSKVNFMQDLNLDSTTPSGFLVFL